MIISCLRIMLPSERRNEMLKTMRSLLGPIRVKPGCIGCTLYRDFENKNAVALVEEWESQQHLDNHIRSHEYRMILALMDMSSVPPEVQFARVSHMAAMETIRSVRKGLSAERKTKLSQGGK